MGPGQAERVAAFLGRHQLIALDSCVFIYEFEEHPRYLDLTVPVFSRLGEPDGLRAVTSAMTMAEVLVPSWKSGDAFRQEWIFSRLITYPNIDWIAADTRISDVAALYRARYRLRTPDAIQAATATVSGATGFVTNDRVFARIPSFETLILEDLV